MDSNLNEPLGESNPFVDDNNMLDLNIGEDDADVQRALQKGDQDISMTMKSPPIHDDFRSLESAKEGLLSGNIESQTQQTEQPKSGGPTNFVQRCLSCCCTFDGVKAHFDVDTQDVTDRIKLSLMPWKNSFFMTVDEKPDLYSPFWLSTTLILLTAMSSNFSLSLSDPDFKKDLNLLLSALSLIYSFAIITPLVLYCGLMYGGSTVKLGLVECVCVYGYGFAPFLIGVIIAAAPFWVMEYLGLGAAFVMSSVFLVRNLLVRLTSDEAENKKTVVGVLAGTIALHFLFALLLKIMFFSHA